MKLAYNITYVVDPQYVDRWRIWMIKNYLPGIMETGCFLSYRLHKLVGLNSNEEPTYSVQLIAKNKIMLQRYQRNHESNYMRLLNHQFKEKYVEFRTTMVVVDES
ncbi:DUF4286 family protein [Membranicola marinus]|uniref:DUF4286 family protein n=1 Tax=Membranihabitans marinus TaxID=1227546 RepID=A0A953HSU8_9BACT|nr:DUF4286 family protein [Membranihabitans marinus]MBY5957770.1 DUF4286 family protein [Membranihabitans marinus]